MQRLPAAMPNGALRARPTALTSPGGNTFSLPQPSTTINSRAVRP